MLFDEHCKFLVVVNFFVCIFEVVVATQVTRLEASVESNGGAEKVVDDVGVVVKLLVDHEAEDAHLGGTTVVELDGHAALISDGGEGFGAILLEFFLALGKAKLNQADEGDSLEYACAGDGVEGGEASLHGGEGQAVGDVTGKTGTSGSHNVAKDGKHGDTAVLVLDSAQALEALLIGISKEAEGIPEAKGRLGAKSVLEAHAEAGGGGNAASRREGGNTDDGGKESKSAEHVSGAAAHQMGREEKIGSGQRNAMRLQQSM